MNKLDFFIAKFKKSNSKDPFKLGLKVDKEIYETVKKCSITITRFGYARATKMVKGKLYQAYLHTLLIDCPEGMDIDHINGNKLDNRKENLRVVTRSENCKNRKCHREGKIPNIYYDHSTPNRVKRWRVGGYKNGKRTTLGYFLTKKEAQNQLKKS